MVVDLEAHSPLGRVLAAGLRNVGSSREIMKESIEEAGSVVSHDLERYLTTLGTIASISPLMGLFGTVVGMIEIFASQAPSGSNPIQLAHGISVALYNTGFGLMIAIPSMIFWRHFRALVDGFVIEMQQQAVRWSRSCTANASLEGAAMNFRRGRSSDVPEINLIPLIDVLLVIIIFLMLTTTYAKFSGTGDQPADRRRQQAERAAERVSVA
jgi:hypothetical protein